MRLAVAAASVLTGCGSYADFSLPPRPGDTAEFRYRAVDARPSPVLTRGASGEFDSVDVLNPSVVRQAGTYYNLYSGFDGRTWHTGLATSSDGVRWAKHGRVLSPDPGTWEGDYIAANGTALANGNEFLYWYQAGGRTPRIGLARSRDAKNWTKAPEPVLDFGPRGSWDERAVADPYVVRFENEFYMFYLGQDRARRQRLGLARSRDGVHWTRLRSNPILELGDPGAFDEIGLGEPAVWAQGGWYWMLYTGRDRMEHRRIGLARSRDGVNWARVARDAVFAGTEPWNARVVCDPTVEVDGRTVRVWYGGGDAAKPDERINGEIGLFHLSPAL